MEKRKPDWLRTPSPLNVDTRSVKKVLAEHGLNTVCRSALCPNQGECFAAGTAAFLIMGPHCTRNCRFCAVSHGIPAPISPNEPEQIAEAATTLNLRFAVVTSVTRDDLPDGGATQFALVIAALHQRGIKVEVLTPDFQGDLGAVEVVLQAGPDIYNHNIETVPRLYPQVRPEANYLRSLELLRYIWKTNHKMSTKSGLMVGLGETDDEVRSVLEDLRGVGCDRITIGQYLRPTPRHLPVIEYVSPEHFALWESFARSIGFTQVRSGPLVRSSYHAGDDFSS